MLCCVKKAVRVVVKLEQKLLVTSSRSWNVKCRVGLAARRAGGRRPLSNSMVAPPPDCSESIKEKAGTCSVAQHNPAARGCTSHFSGADQPLPQFGVLIRQRVRCSSRAHEMELAVSQADDATGAIGTQISCSSAATINSKSIIARCSADVAKRKQIPPRGRSPKGNQFW